MKYIQMLLAATFSVPVVAQADVLHDQPLASIDTGYCSPCSGSQESYDYRTFGSFSLTSSGILQSGSFAISDTLILGNDLSISIWDVPFGTELYSLTALEGSYTTTPYPNNFFYYANIELPNWPLPAGSYWISLFGINGGTLGWGSDTRIGDDAQYTSDGISLGNVYVGFTLFGEPVPEPSSLLLCAIAAFMVRGRRQRGRFSLGKFR